MGKVHVPTEHVRAASARHDLDDVVGLRFKRRGRSDVGSPRLLTSAMSTPPVFLALVGTPPFYGPTVVYRQSLTASKQPTSTANSCNSICGYDWQSTAD